MTHFDVMTATTSNRVKKNFTSQKLLKLMDELRAPINFFDAAKTAHGIVPHRGDLFIISKELMNHLMSIKGVQVPFWVKASSFLPDRNVGYILRGDWQDDLIKITRGIDDTRHCTECGESFVCFADTNAILCQKCDLEEKLNKIDRRDGLE